MSIRRGLAGLLLALATLAPHGATASHGSGGCGAPTDRNGNPTWITARAASCTFDIRGLPVTVWGQARDPVSNRSVTIRVWVTLAEEHDLSRTTGHQPAVVVECSSSGAGFATCADDLSVGEVLDPGRGVIGRFRCNASATGTGSWTPQMVYWCSVGSGIG